MAKCKSLPGDLLEIELDAGNTGFVKVIRSDGFGLLIQLANPATGEFDLEYKDSVVYVNLYSVRNWKKVGFSPVDNVMDNLPTFFFGSSATVWTIQAKEGVSYIKGNDASMDELLKKGYVQKVLWHGNDIKEYFKGKPLIWPFKL
ncbi:MAG: hypothetical protein KA419_13415 [Acidobacteria bacterium]|nr:hypothetical protein [Acidobacteriota bacterium]